MSEEGGDTYVVVSSEQNQEGSRSWRNKYKTVFGECIWIQQTTTFLLVTNQIHLRLVDAIEYRQVKV